MRSWLRYGLTAVGVVAAVLGAVWPLLDEAGRWGVLTAGAIALPVQLVAFGCLVPQRDGSPGFLAAWVGGTFVRLAAVAGATVWVVRTERVDTASTLLALVGLLFVLMLLEPWVLRGRESRDRTIRSGHDI